MDPNANSTATPASVPAIDAYDWDTDGFVIPSLSVEESGAGGNPLASKATTCLAPPEVNKTGKQQEANYESTLHSNESTGRKQKLKHKLKEADRKFVGTIGQENRTEILKELLGGKEANYENTLPKGSSRDWLDPHCNESEFERSSP